MRGFQLTFMTEQGRRIEGKPAVEWLLRAAKDVGCSGATTFAGMESYGAGGHHSAHFIELADQPVQVIMAVTDEQAAALFSKIDAVKTRLFYTKTAIEYGSVGSESESL
jgi:PII-like signaling protein